MEWQRVHRKTRKRSEQKKKKKQKSENFVYSNMNETAGYPNNVELAQSLVEEINVLMDQIATTEFFEELEKTLHTCLPASPAELVCYGMGSLVQGSGKNCAHQLALACLLRQRLSIPSTSAYDPVLQEVDQQVLQSLNVHQLDNEGGRRVVDTPTLFFMPHCPMRLYSNLLWANWGERLRHVSILGNSFEAYNDRIIDAESRNDPSNCILRLLPLKNEAECPFVEKKNSQVPFGFSAFNDLSLITFLDSTMQSEEAEKILAIKPAEFHNEILNASTRTNEFVDSAMHQEGKATIT